MGKSKAPPPPDPFETASAEAQFNRLDTYSPSGSGVRYGYTDANGNFVQGTPPKGNQAAVTQIESPWEKAIRERLQPASVALTDRIVADNITNMPQAPRAQDRGTVAQSIFDRNFSMMMPGIEKANSRLLNNLQARGIPIGAGAFNDAMGEQQRNTEDTISRLAMDADIAAGQEQSRQFNLDAASRQGAIAELVAAMGGNYNPPSATPSGNADGINYSGLVGQQYQQQVQAAAQSNAAKAQTAGALGSLGGALLMKSDRRLKRDIRLVGQRGGLNVYEYRYAWERPGIVRRGFMAQEVAQVFPQAVRRIGLFLQLDYSQLPEVA